MNFRIQRSLAFAAFLVFAACPGFAAGDIQPASGSAPAAPGVLGQKLEKRTFKDCLLRAVKSGGFKMDEFILWCPSVIKVGDTFHMFASRWPAQYGLGGWTSYSEAVRATATNFLGPYLFQEVVLQK